MESKSQQKRLRIQHQPSKAELMKEYPKGCPRPFGYAAFFDWAAAQFGHGLKQSRCPKCLRWTFPQENCACDGKGSTA